MKRRTPHHRVLFTSSPKRYGRGLFVAACVALVGITTVVLSSSKTAYAVANPTINFQARLMNTNGSVVADGNYNIEFKLYSVSSGGSTLWTEDWLNSASQGIAVSNGYLTANLGSITSFAGSSIPWGSSLWLTINIGGTTTGTPSWDGEMSPRLALTSVPSALSLVSSNNASNVSTLGFVSPTSSQSLLLPVGPNATNYVCYQGDTSCGFAPGTVASYIGNQTSLQTNANFYIQARSSTVAATLEANGADILDLQNSTPSNVVAFTSTGVMKVVGAQAADITTFDSAAGVANGITIKPGASGGTNNAGGTITIVAGTGLGTGAGGLMTIQGGSGGAGAAALGGNVQIQGGTANGTGISNGGNIILQGGTGSGTGVKGQIQINGALLYTTASYSSGSSATITQSLVDSNTTILATATAASLTFTVPTLASPSITTAGRILLISNVGTNNFTLAGAGSNFILTVGSTATLMWNGSAWTDAGVDATTLQTAYNNSTSGATAPQITLSTAGDGISIQTDGTLGNGHNFLSLRNSGAGLGTIEVGFGIGGNYFQQPTTDATGVGNQLFLVKSHANNQLFLIDSLNSVLSIGAIGTTSLATTINLATSTSGNGTINVGSATSGSAANGTAVLVQGGNGASAVSIQSLASGTINIGTNNAANTVQVGSTTLNSGTQSLNIGTNTTAGGTTSVTIGSQVGSSGTAIYGGTSAITLMSGQTVAPLWGYGHFQNLLLYSEAIDPTNSAGNWAVSNVTATANALMAPDGNTTAESLVDSASGGRINETPSVASGSTYTFSIWLRTTTGNTQAVALRIDGASSGTGTPLNATINERWQRYTVTQNTSGFTGNVRVNIFPGGTGASNANTVYAWGAQLEAGSTTGAYTQVAGSAFTQSGTGFQINGQALIRTTSNSAAAIQVVDQSSNLALVVSTNNVTGSGNAANAILKVAQDSGTGRSINASGTINASGADYAEYFAQSTPGALQKGDVVCLTASGLAKACSISTSGTLLGAVSSRPGYVGNDIFDPAHPQNTALVGLLGQIEVKVSAASGSIHAGDMLTMSATPGVAVRATQPGMILGSALENYNGSGVGEVNVYVHIGYADPTAGVGNVLQSNNNFVQNGGNATLTSLNVSGPAVVQSLTVTGQATIANLTVIGGVTTTSLTVNGHIITGGNAPAVTAGSGACSSANAAVMGDDTAGAITLVTGRVCTGGGKLLTVTFSTPFGTAPAVLLTPSSNSAATLPVFVDGATVSADSFDINSSTPVAANTTYTWYYHVLQ